MSGRPDDNPLVEERWRTVLTGEESGQSALLRRASEVERGLLGLLPGHPRCKICHAPFDGVGAPFARHVLGKRPSNVTPRLCNRCETLARRHLGGAEVELSMLFADVRGSSRLAADMTTAEFSQLINRFYKAGSDVLGRTGALIDRLVGDQVAGFYVPGVAGPDHARQALDAARELLRVTGHTGPDAPWIPVGVGVHTGVAFIGAVGSRGGVTDITALGEAVNTAAHLASQAAPGEIIVSANAATGAELDLNGLESRQIEVKGRSETLAAWVAHPTPA